LSIALSETTYRSYISLCELVPQSRVIKNLQTHSQSWHHCGLAERPDFPGLLSQLKWCFEGYDVVTAEDRVSAINELRRHEPTVVLQDLGLPPNPEGVDEGLATLQELLKLSPHTKVIVVTGHGDQENALKSVALGAYDFYQKPVDTETLQLLVERAFSMSMLEGENRRLHVRRQTNGTDVGFI